MAEFPLLLTGWTAQVTAFTHALFEVPVPGESFVLFPLQFQPEASTLVRGYLYENQVALVEDIAKSSETRFLIITHHRLTMARMDRLFGVTMAERGVSQLVSVDLQQAEVMVAAE